MNPSFHPAADALKRSLPIPSMQNPKQESKILAHLEEIYIDTEGAARRTRVRIAVFSVASIALMALGMYLSKLGVIQGLCDILICLSGFCLAYAAFYYGMNRTIPFLKEYTRLDQEQLTERIAKLKQ
jgi:hypothetical protein